MKNANLLFQGRIAAEAVEICCSEKVEKNPFVEQLESGGGCAVIQRIKRETGEPTRWCRGKFNGWWKSVMFVFLNHQTLEEKTNTYIV